MGKLQKYNRTIYIVLTVLILIIIICVCKYSLGKNINLIRILHTHYFEDPPEMLFEIVEDKEIEELISYFDKLDYHPSLDEHEVPIYYPGLGCDYISFYDDGELIRQYTVAGKFIQYGGEDVWYVMSKENMIQWNVYIKNLKTP